MKSFQCLVDTFLHNKAYRSKNFLYAFFLTAVKLHIIADNHSVNKTILNCSKKIIEELLNDCSGSRNQCQTKLFLCKTKNQFETIKKTIGGIQH